MIECKLVPDSWVEMKEIKLKTTTPIRSYVARRDSAFMPDYHNTYYEPTYGPAQDELALHGAYQFDGYGFSSGRYQV